MVLKRAGKEINRFWTAAKRLLFILGAWGLVFSVATIGRFAVAFDYDDGLASTASAFAKARAGTLPLTDSYWSAVNNSYELDRPKAIPYLVAWMFRLCGFRVTVISERPAIDSEALAKDWRHLVPMTRFIFAGDAQRIHSQLSRGRYLLYFGSSDEGIQEARLAHVYPIRILRGARSASLGEYHPKSLGELVLPLSQYAF